MPPAARARIAVVVDLDMDRVGVVSGHVSRAVLVLDPAGGVQVRVEIGDGSRERHDAEAASRDDHVAVVRGVELAAGTGREAQRDELASGVDVAQVERREVEVAQGVLEHHDLRRKAPDIGRIVVDRGDADRPGPAREGHAVADLEAEDAIGGIRALARVLVRDASQSRLIIGYGGGSGQRQDTRCQRRSSR